MAPYLVNSFLVEHLQSSVVPDSIRAMALFIFRLAHRACFALLAFLGLFGSLVPTQTGTAIQQVAAQSQYLLGLGIGDVTGPVVETNMMGYADLSQNDTGLHMRQRSRAFIVANPSNPSERIVFVNSDISMGDHGLRRDILARLNTLYPGVYTEANFALVGTHSHAGVGGFASNLLPQLTSLGFVKATHDAIVAGTVNAISRAHRNLALGTLSVGNATVLDANINRSPAAYEANPASERARYSHDVEKEMSLLKFTDASGTQRGFISFFPVHGTSLYQNNTLVSGDNKGMAAYLYESFVEPSVAPGNTSFVAGFTQTSVGDTSPNTLGAWCEAPGKPYHGQPCDYLKSTCGNTTQECRGHGPGYRISDFESNRIIGQRQFEGARGLMGQTLAPVAGAVKSLHTFVNMSNYTFKLSNGTSVHTCPPAMGYSFAGGTTDGPGAFDFTQGTTSPNAFWEIVKGAVSPLPNEEQKACHAPKPILLNTGYATWPYSWQPSTVNVQMLRVGQVVILIVPGEFTTMAGRRIKEAVRTKLIANGIIGSNAYVLLAGPANTYAHYITTREEYSIQRYEGGSTLYGPYTLEAFTDIYTNLVSFLADGSTSAPPPGTPHPDERSSYISLQTGVVLDAAPIGSQFGKPLTNPAATYSKGQKVFAVFQGANPRNNLRLDNTFWTVERQTGSTWVTHKTDSHPSTKFHWLRTNTVLGHSTVNCTWDIENDTPNGNYRIRYFGDSRSLFGNISPFVGTSSTFAVSG